jgi:hypothetical protein
MFRVIHKEYCNGNANTKLKPKVLFLGFNQRVFAQFVETVISHSVWQS